MVNKINCLNDPLPSGVFSGVSDDSAKLKPTAIPPRYVAVRPLVAPGRPGYNKKRKALVAYGRVGQNKNTKLENDVWTCEKKRK